MIRIRALILCFLEREEMMSEKMQDGGREYIMFDSTVVTKSCGGRDEFVVCLRVDLSFSMGN